MCDAFRGCDAALRGALPATASGSTATVAKVLAPNGDPEAVQLMVANCGSTSPFSDSNLL